MRVISRRSLNEFAARFPDAAPGLNAWYRVARDAGWTNLVQVRRNYPSADPVRVKSGRSVVVFNIGGNKYRLIAAIHYNRQLLYVLHILTHSEYDRLPWKDQL